MSVSQPCIPSSALTLLTSGPDSALVRACRSFCDGFGHFEKSAAAFDLAESQDCTDPRTIELQASAEAALTEYRQLARKVGTTPARHAVGLRAKAGVLGVLLAHSGASGIEAELTWSLATSS